MNSEKKLDYQTLLKNATMAMRIIVFALAMGKISFLAISLIVLNPEKSDDWFLPSLGIGFGLVLITLSYLIPNIVSGRMRYQKDSPSHANPYLKMASEDCQEEAHWINVYQNRLVLGAAMAEAAGFVNLIFYVVAGNYLSLTFIGLSIPVLLTWFPSSFGINQWVKEQIRFSKNSFD